MSRNRQALERAAATSEPYNAALQWVKAHRGVPLIPQVYGAQAELEHDMYLALAGHPVWPKVVCWVVPGPNGITVQLDADHTDTALAALLPHHGADTRLTGIAGVRATADGEDLLLARGSATARLRSTTHLARRMAGLCALGALWQAGTSLSIAEKMILDSAAITRTAEGSDKLRHIGEAHQDHLGSASEAWLDGDVCRADLRQGVRRQSLRWQQDPQQPSTTPVGHVASWPRPVDRPERLLGGLGGVVLLPALFARVPLPLSRVADHVVTNNVGLSVRMSAGGWPEAELPFGTTGRLLLIMLTTAVVQAGSRVVCLEHDRFAGPDGDQDHRHLQALAAMQVDVGYRTDSHQAGSRFCVATSVAGGHDLTVTVSEEFQAAVVRRVVSLRTTAVRVLAGSPAALDLYAHLAHRLPILNRAVAIPRSQMSGGGKDLIDLLDRVQAIYPQARVTLDRTTLVLHPSPPPVPACPQVDDDQRSQPGQYATSVADWPATPSPGEVEGGVDGQV